MENKSAHHCCFGDGPEAVDENVAGYVDRRTWREGAERHEKLEFIVFMQTEDVETCLSSQNVENLLVRVDCRAQHGFNTASTLQAA